MVLLHFDGTFIVPEYLKGEGEVICNWNSNSCIHFVAASTLEASFPP
jgi:hypothetical protein